MNVIMEWILIIIAAGGQPWVGRGQESRVAQRGDPRHSSLDHAGTRFYIRWWRWSPCLLWSLSSDHAPHMVQYDMVGVVASSSWIRLSLVFGGHISGDYEESMSPQLTRMFEDSHNNQNGWIVFNPRKSWVPNEQPRKPRYDKSKVDFYQSNL